MKVKFLKKGAWKRWLSTVLAVTMLVGVGMSDKVYAGVNGSDSVPENYTSDENGLMAYCYTSGIAEVNITKFDSVIVDAIDIMGYVESNWRGTTYNNLGNTVIFKIGDEIIPVKKIDGSAPIKDGVNLYVKVTPEFVSNGQLIKLTYTVENKGSDAVDYSIAGQADANFAGNDKCPIVNVGEVKNGSAFALNHTVDDKTISFAVFPLSASTSNYYQYNRYENYFVDGINGFWFDDLQREVKSKNLKQEDLGVYDSAYSFAWNNQTLGAGESKSYSALFGVGDLENLKAAEEEAAHTHTYGEWVIVTPAGCVDKGSKKRACSTCGNEETEDINPNGHTVVTDTAVLPTCTTTGLTAGSHCSVCGEIITAQTTVAALGHEYGEWVIVTPAGCVDKGSKKRVCSTCGNEETEDINPNGHTVVTDTAVLPTCTTTGLTAGSHCSVCGEIITAQTTVAALGHDWSNDWVVTKPATTITEGKKECTCKREGCNQKKYEVIPATGTTTISAKEQEKNEFALNAGLKVSQTGSNINVAWGKVTEADGYDVYVQYCGMKFTAKSINSVNKGKTTKIVVKKVNGKKLDLKKNYKVYVEAYKLENGEKVSLGKTITAHIVGRNNKTYTNVKKVTVKKSSFTLTKGKTAQIQAKNTLVNPKRKQLTNAHAKEFRYASTDKTVATVSSKGKIKAVGKGSCTIYVYARNGYAKKVKVKVK